MFGKTKRKLGLVLKASRRMRKRYRDRLVKMELGWRQTDARRQATTDLERQRLADFTRRYTRIEWSRLNGSQQLCVTLHFDGRLFDLATPVQDTEVFVHLARQLAYMLERELRTLNFATLSDHIHAAERRRAEAKHAPSWFHERV